MSIIFHTWYSLLHNGGAAYQVLLMAYKCFIAAECTEFCGDYIDPCNSNRVKIIVLVQVSVFE